MLTHIISHSRNTNRITVLTQGESDQQNTQKIRIRHLTDGWRKPYV